MEPDRDRRDEPAALLLAVALFLPRFPPLDLGGGTPGKETQRARRRYAVVERAPGERREEAEGAASGRGQGDSDIARKPAPREKEVFREKLRDARREYAGDPPHHPFARRPVQVIGERLGGTPA